MDLQSLSAALEVAKAAEPDRSAPVKITVGGELVEIVFERVDGKLWASQCAKYAPRPDVPIDRNYGYNFHQVVISVSPESGRLVTDDGLLPLDDDQWRGIYAEGVLSGHDFQRVADAIWQVNEWGPQQKVAALSKASARASKRNSDSPEK